MNRSKLARAAGYTAVVGYLALVVHAGVFAGPSAATTTPTVHPTPAPSAAPAVVVAPAQPMSSFDFGVWRAQQDAQQQVQDAKDALAAMKSRMDDMEFAQEVAQIDAQRQAQQAQLAADMAQEQNQAQLRKLQPNPWACQGPACPR